jgi:hypothetical protein
MPSTDVLLHVEIVHPDPDAAAEVLIKRFDGARVEVRTSDYMETLIPGARIVHVLAGTVVFQLIRPSAEMTDWAEQLAAQGPSIFCLSFRVDDYGSRRDGFLEEGAEMTADFVPLPDFSSIGMGKGPFEGGIVDTRELFGCRLELIDALSGWEVGGKAP